MGKKFMDKEKTIVLSIIFGFVLFSVLSWFPNPELKDFIRTGIGTALCACLYAGKSWARWTLGFLSGLAFLGGVISLIAIKSSILGNTLLAIMCLFYGCAAFVLLNPNLLKSHFNHEPS